MTGHLWFLAGEIWATVWYWTNNCDSFCSCLVIGCLIVSIYSENNNLQTQAANNSDSDEEDIQVSVAVWNTSTFRYLLYYSWSRGFVFQWTDDETTTTVTVRLIPLIQSKPSWSNIFVQVLNCGYLPQAPEFPEFNVKVQEAINVLGGCVFPKLNWSAPRVRKFYSQLHFIHMNLLYSQYSSYFCLPLRMLTGLPWTVPCSVRV